MSNQPDLSLLKRIQPSVSEPAAVPVPPRRWVGRTLLPGLVGGAFLLLILSLVWQWLNPPLEVEVVPVVARPIAGSVAADFQAPGWLEPEPWLQVVPALAAGVVREVLVLEGDSVRTGSVLAHLVDEEARLALTRLEEEFLRQSAEVAVAAARLQAADANWRYPVSLEEKVAVGSHRLAEAEAEQQRTQAEMAAAEARETELKERLRREGHLARQDAIAEYSATRTALELATQQALTRALAARLPVIQARIEQLRAEVHSARENLRLRIADRQRLEEARALLDRARADLAVARVKRDEAALRLSRMSIRSPGDGVILRRLIRPGDLLSAEREGGSATQAFHLYDPRRLQVRVDVPLADASRVHPGQSAEVVVDILPDRTWKGRVSRIVPEADIQKNTLQVKVALEDPDILLKPEMLSRVRFLPQTVATENQTLALFVPEAVLRRNPEGQSRVFVMDLSEKRARDVVVTLGTRRVDQWVEILSGLMPGDRLITSPLDRVEHGMAVRPAGREN